MSGPDAYEQFVRRQLEREFSRRAELDQRGSGVVTSSAGLVTLLFGLTALVRSDLRLRAFQIVLLTLATAAFVTAAVFGLLASRLERYTVLDAAALEKLRTGRWTDSDTDALSVVTYAEIRTLQGVRHGNVRKATFLSVALLFQILSAALVGATIAWVLAGSLT